MKVTSFPSAAATGIIKRRVEPLSIELSSVSLFLSASIIPTVACISLDEIIGLTVPPPARKEHINALCATDLDAGTVTSPLNIDF